MKKKIGLLMGTFDPIHIGHIAVAMKVLGDKLVDKVYFVPSPQNPWKENKPASFEVRNLMITELLGKELKEYSSRGLVGMIHGGFCNYNPSDLQDEDGNYYSYKQLQKILIEIGEDDEYYIIGGTDVSESIKAWKNHEWIEEHFKFLGLERPGYSDKAGPMSIGCSSTHIREMVREGKIVFPWVLGSTVDIINRYKLYRDE